MNLQGDWRYALRTQLALWGLLLPEENALEAKKGFLQGFYWVGPECPSLQLGLGLSTLVRQSSHIRCLHVAAAAMNGFNSGFVGVNFIILVDMCALATHLGSTVRHEEPCKLHAAVPGQTQQNTSSQFWHPFSYLAW